MEGSCRVGAAVVTTQAHFGWTLTAAKAHEQQPMWETLQIRTATTQNAGSTGLHGFTDQPNGDRHRACWARVYPARGRWVVGLVLTDARKLSTHASTLRHIRCGYPVHQVNRKETQRQTLEPEQLYNSLRTRQNKGEDRVPRLDRIPSGRRQSAISVTTRSEKPRSVSCSADVSAPTKDPLNKDSEKKRSRAAQPSHRGDVLLRQRRRANAPHHFPCTTR